jgi:eukaryotic-like serine/threonine-protein kinase
MGIVYKAEDLNLHRPVAIKTIATEAPGARARLLIEAEAAASLNHPNICTIYEVDRQHHLLAMEFIDGTTIAEKVRSGPLPLEEALGLQFKQHRRSGEDDVAALQQRVTIARFRMA